MFPDLPGAAIAMPLGGAAREPARHPLHGMGEGDAERADRVDDRAGRHRTGGAGPSAVDGALMPRRAPIACPACDGVADAVRRGAVEDDRCRSCGGVWLDCGELEVLLSLAYRTGKDRAARAEPVPP